MIQNNHIFDNLTEHELIITDRLKQIIINEIKKSNNKIPLSKYIELALYHPSYGYYSNTKLKFGKGGDFITAPLLSDIFAGCVVRQLEELLINMKVDYPNILEFGAGNGQLMLDILKSDVHKKISEYQIVELSSNLRSLQQSRLQEHLPHLVDKVKWLDKLPNSFDGVIIGNEILDAIPTEVVTWYLDSKLSQRFVMIENNGFVYCDEPIPADSEVFKLAKQIKPAIDNLLFTSEVNVLMRGFIKTLSDILNRGYILLVDYGYSQNEYYMANRNGGTLRGFYRQHLLEDILLYPGLIDITASVDFSAVATTAIDNKLDLIGYTTQANFLLNCGVLDIIRDRKQNLSSNLQVDLLNQFNYLTSPNLMGDIFKVIGFSKNIDLDNWLGFCYNDRSCTL